MIGLSFPENVTVIEEECGLQDIIHYENDSYYLLTIDYNETGPLEIAVTFSSNVCNKTTVIQYNSKSLVDIVIIKYVRFYLYSQEYSDQC